MASTHYSRKMEIAASERGKRMAAERWRRDRERRDLLASMAPERMTAKIIRRIIVIDGETTVREAVFTIPTACGIHGASWPWCCGMPAAESWFDVNRE